MATIHTPVTADAVLVYTPSPIGVPKVTLVNEGKSVVYIGQAGVTSASGLPLQPLQSVTLPFAPYSLYAVSGGALTATTANTNAAAVAGATTLSFAASFVGTVNGQQIQVGTGSAAEGAQIVSGGGTATLTVTALAYDHKIATVVTVVTPGGSAVHTESGV